MKNITLPISITLPAAIIFELVVMLVLQMYFGIGVSIIAGLIVMVPMALFLIKQYIPQISIPAPIVLILCGAVLEMGTTPLRLYTGMQVSAIGGFTLLLLVTFIFLKQFSAKVKPYMVTLYLLIGISVIQLPTRLYDFKGTLISLPDYFIHLLGIIAGLFFYQREKIFQKVNLSVSVLVVLFVYFYGYNLWMNKIDYGSFSGETHFKSPPTITLKNADNNLIAIKKGKLTVMDFWFVGCKACFDGFPKFQKLYTGYKNNPNVQFYSVNQPFPNESNENRFKELTQRGYTFPMASADAGRTLVKSLQIAVYPTVVVMDDDGYVVYKGDLDGATSTIKSYLQADTTND